MTAEDIPAVVEIEKECFSLPWSEKSFLDSIQREDTIFLVCIDTDYSNENKSDKVLSFEKINSSESAWIQNDTLILQNILENKSEIQCFEINHANLKKEQKVIGYIGMYLSFDEAEITNVAVSPEHRQKGIGKVLVETVKEMVCKKNIKKIFLEVRVSNIPAIALYEKNGFQKVGIRKNFYEKPTEDANIMLCEL